MRAQCICGGNWCNDGPLAQDPKSMRSNSQPSANNALHICDCTVSDRWGILCLFLVPCHSDSLRRRQFSRNVKWTPTPVQLHPLGINAARHMTRGLCNLSAYLPPSLMCFLRKLPVSPTAAGLFFNFIYQDGVQRFEQLSHP